MNNNEIVGYSPVKYGYTKEEIIVGFKGYSDKQIKQSIKTTKSILEKFSSSPLDEEVKEYAKIGLINYINTAEEELAKRKEGKS